MNSIVDQVYNDLKYILKFDYCVDSFSLTKETKVCRIFNPNQDYEDTLECFLERLKVSIYVHWEVHLPDTFYLINPNLTILGLCGYIAYEAYGD